MSGTPERESLFAALRVLGLHEQQTVVLREQREDDFCLGVGVRALGFGSVAPLLGVSEAVIQQQQDEVRRGSGLLDLSGGEIPHAEDELIRRRTSLRRLG